MFRPTVSVGRDALISIWVPELALYGTGRSCEAAKQDLLIELRVYAEEWLERPELREAPNRRLHEPYVRAIHAVADESGWTGLERLVFFPGLSCASEKN